MIELLLSLALLAVLVGFVVGGLSMAQRAFAVDAANTVNAEGDEAIGSVMNLVAGALPVLKSDQSVVFEGSAEHVRFVALSEGRSLRGGPYRVDLRRVGNELIVEIGKWPTSATQDPAGESTSVVVLRSVRAVHFSYFGSRARSDAQQGWREEWGAAQAMPRLVSLRIEFEDGTRNGPASVVALRNG